jgi:PKD repeat protein
VQNKGNETAINTVVKDTFSSLENFISGNPYPNSIQRNPTLTTITWKIGNLEPGQTSTIIYQVQFPPIQSGCIYLKNVAETWADNAEKHITAEFVTKVCNNNPQPVPPKPTPNPINITINPPEKICINAQSKFVFTFTGGVAPYQYVVTFGDNTKQVEGTESGKFVTLTHVYKEEGSYKVEITVKDSKGTTSTLSKLVNAKNCKVVLDVYHQNFIIGYPDGMFKPERTVTRAEVATMLIRALGFDASKIYNHYLPFKDIPSSNWAFNFVKKAYEEKLMFGVSNTVFNPNKPATRAEIATILVRIRGLKPETPQEELFTDIKPTDWFNGYVYTAVKAGLIQGYKDHTFRPNNKVSRAEFVTMLDRALYREDIPQMTTLSIVKSPFPDVKKNYWAYRYIIEAAIPHIVTNAIRAPINLSTTTKTIPVYLASTKSEIVFPKLNSTVTAIVPVDGIISGKDPAKRKLTVRIINKGTP